MEFYKLGGIDDMPQIIVHMMDMPERGVIGIGEPPTISTHAAIGNAIFNAIGVRVADTPLHARTASWPPWPAKGGKANHEELHLLPADHRRAGRRPARQALGQRPNCWPAAPTCSTCRRNTSPSRTRSSA